MSIPIAVCAVKGINLPTPVFSNVSFILKFV